MYCTHKHRPNFHIHSLWFIVSHWPLPPASSHVRGTCRPALIATQQIDAAEILCYSLAWAQTGFFRGGAVFQEKGRERSCIQDYI
jgi:hypothetical protein